MKKRVRYVVYLGLRGSIKWTKQENALCAELTGYSRETSARDATARE